MDFDEKYIKSVIDWSLFRSNSYLILMIIMMLIFGVITFGLKLHIGFYQLYQINHDGINTALTTVFGVLLAFVFTILTLLFSLKEDSLFLKLIKLHDRNKKDIINYFNISLIAISVVLLISLFLTVTYVPDETIEHAGLTFFDQIRGINIFLIHSMLFLIEFSFINLLLLITMFILIIRES